MPGRLEVAPFSLTPGESGRVTHNNDSGNFEIELNISNEWHTVGTYCTDTEANDALVLIKTWAIQHYMT